MRRAGVTYSGLAFRVFSIVEDTVLNSKCVALVEQLARELDSEGASFAMVTLVKDGNFVYSGNVPFDDGARLMREWLDSAEDGAGP